MADKQPKKAKRTVKDPETFRERAIKATETNAKPGKQSSVKRGRKVTGWLAAPFRRLANFKVVRLIGKVIFPSYLRGSWRELKQVTWPNWKQSRQLTFAVLIFAVVFGAVIAAVDYGLDKVFRNILLK